MAVIPPRPLGSRCSSFGPGHLIHHIHARKALDAERHARTVENVDVTTGIVTLDHDAVRWTHDPARLLQLVEDLGPDVVLNKGLLEFRGPTEEARRPLVSVVKLENAEPCVTSGPSYRGVEAVQPVVTPGEPWPPDLAVRRPAVGAT